jgi:hypothetical protein
MVHMVTSSMAAFRRKLNDALCIAIPKPWIARLQIVDGFTFFDLLFSSNAPLKRLGPKRGAIASNGGHPWRYQALAGHEGALELIRGLFGTFHGRKTFGEDFKARVGIDGAIGNGHVFDFGLGHNFALKALSLQHGPFDGKS